MDWKGVGNISVAYQKDARKVHRLAALNLMRARSSDSKFGMKDHPKYNFGFYVQD